MKSFVFLLFFVCVQGESGFPASPLNTDSKNFWLKSDLQYHIRFKCDYSLTEGGFDVTQLSDSEMESKFPSCLDETNWWWNIIEDIIVNGKYKKVYATIDPKYTIQVAEDSCCFSKRDYCPGCHKSWDTVQKKCGAFFYVYNNGVLLRTYNDPPVYWCRGCILLDCITTCDNGQYATFPAIYEPTFNIQTNQKTECRRCQEGTWNTCGSGASCKWVIPDEHSDTGNHSVQKTDTLNRIYPFGLYGAPVGSCYLCNLGQGQLGHYTDTPMQSVTSKVDIYCAGGTEPPRDCPDGFVSSHNWDTCVCPDGQYGDMNTKTCTDCEPGYFCVNGKKTQCPIHTYQDKRKQTECKKCSNTGDENGRAEYKCPTSQLLQWCDPGDIMTQNRLPGLNCKPCSQCLYGSQLDDTPQPAYKVKCYDN